MRIAVLNPNTHHGMTAAVCEQLAARLPGSFEFVPITSDDGPRVIATPQSYAEGAASALRLAARVPDDADGVLLACFGDPGLAELRDAIGVPVVGMAETAMQAATARGERFAIVTAGLPWRDMLWDFARRHGLDGGLLDVFALDVNGAQLVAEPDRYRVEVGALSRWAADAGARTLMFGGAAFAGLEFEVDSRLAVLDVVAVCAGRLARRADAG